MTINEVELIEFFGQNNSKLKLVKDKFPMLTISSRGNTIKISGDKKMAQKAKGQLELLLKLLKEYEELSIPMIKDVLTGTNPFESKLPKHNNKHIIVHGRNGKPITARTKNQKKLVESAEENDILFAIGPAGTGKTYTAVALAVKALKNREVRRIILTRPAVEAGENLGFLPGDLKDKIDPYLRPLYDALDDLIPSERLEHMIESRVIEIAPLAFMRGRTLDNAFIILDEAQNATTMQLKMFLTRIGPTARAIITGDLSQIDLPRNHQSGLFRALDILGNIDGIGIVKLSGEDVVRHRLVRMIINAYDVSDVEMKKRAEERKANDNHRKERRTDINRGVRDL